MQLGFIWTIYLLRFLGLRDLEYKIVKKRLEQLLKELGGAKA